MILLGESGLFGRKPFLTVDGCPGNSSMPAAQELLVRRFVAAPAIRRGELFGDHKAVMIFVLLVGSRLMAFQATDMFHRVDAHLIFVYDAVLQAVVALRAFAGSAHQGGIRLRDFTARAGAVKKKSANDQSERQNDGDEDGAEPVHIGKSNAFCEFGHLICAISHEYLRDHSYGNRS